ncbi:hypothetical protein, partial [Thiolapillus sp.]|uniref:hypothetical protein n=1 Tax=Thiolapillus sp. TaxID=2017437 RepID=UPI0025FE0AAD
PSQNLHPNNSPDLFKSDTGDDRLPQNPVGGGVGKYDKVEISRLTRSRKRLQVARAARAGSTNSKNSCPTCSDVGLMIRRSP